MSNKQSLKIASRETAAERWARWKAKRTQDPSPSRPCKVADQRRHAQRLSVLARRRNAVLLRQRERDLARQARERKREREAALSGFLHGTSPLRQVVSVLTVAEREERRLRLEHHWENLMESQTIAVHHNARPLVVNMSALTILEQALGYGVVWVRACFGWIEHRSLTSTPLRSWWKSDGQFTLAMRVKDCEYDRGNPMPYQHRVEVYWLRPTDLLEHDERGPHDVPAEAVPWASVLAATSIIRIVGLPVPSIRQATRAIKRYWHEGGPRQVPMPA